MPVGTINAAKEQASTYQPLLLATITFSDGTVLRLASHAVTYSGNAYLARIVNKDVAATQALSDQGIDVPASVNLRLADADLFLWANYEKLHGFKGSKIELRAVLYDVVANEFSSDSRVIFKGICREPGGKLPGHDGKILTVSYFSRLGLADLQLPTIRVQKTCPWTFPSTSGQRTAGADDPDSEFYQCGYAPDAASGNARGNYASGSTPFTACGYTKDDCVARGMYLRDGSNRVTGRFGGIQWNPPESVTVRPYGGKFANVENRPNEAKYGDPVPLLFGRYMTEPLVITMVPDGNYLKMEVLVCYGYVDTIYDVVVNDTWIPHGPGDTHMPELGGVSRSDALKGGWWLCSNRGDRDGSPTVDSGFTDGNGDPQGDPHGSMCVLEIVVPRKVADVGSIPRVRVLATRGDFGSGSGSGASPAKHLEEILKTWCGFPAGELDSAGFDAAKAIDDVVINYTNQWGQAAARWRFTSSLYLRQRASAAEIVRGLRNSRRGILVPTSDGKLTLRTEQTLAAQQPAAVAGSNYNTAITSKLANGTAANGYAAYKFDESNILEMPQFSLLTAGNRLNIQFPNAENRHSIDTYAPLDSEDIQRSDQDIPGSFTVLGADNFGQLQRLVATFLAKQTRGNWRGDTAGTLQMEIVAGFRGVHLAVGDIVLVNWELHSIANQLFRVQRIAPENNFERARFTLAWHSDDWYVDTYGQASIPRPASNHRNLLLRPAFAWMPFGVQPPTGIDPMFGAQFFFTVAQRYTQSADGATIAQVEITGRQPVNVTLAKPNPPAVPSQGNTASTGGFLAGDSAYYVAFTARDSAGRQSPLSPLCTIYVPAGTNTNTITVPGLVWDAGTVSIGIFAGRNPSALALQLIQSGTPSSVTIDYLAELTMAPPDTELDRLRYRVKRVVHSGPWTARVLSVTSTTIRVEVPSPGFTANEFNGYNLSLLAIADSEDPVPPVNWTISSHTTDTFTITGVSPVSLGLAAGDVVALRSKMTDGYSEVSGIGQLVDSGWQNATRPDGLEVNSLTGNMLRIISGTGKGQLTRITSNTATAIFGQFAIHPDSTSRYIIEEPNWQLVTDSAPIDNASDSVTTIAQLDLTNYSQKTLLVEVVTLDGGGTQSEESSSPFREIYLYGQQERSVTVTEDYDQQPEDAVILVDSTAGAVTVQLLASADWQVRQLVVKKISTDSNVVTIAAAAGKDIDGAATVTLTAQWAFWVGKRGTTDA